jgi:hypothetical protein
MRIKDVLCYYSNTARIFIERTNDISVKLQKIAEGVEVQISFFFAGYEILTEGTGSNAGTCLINLKIGTIGNLLLRL